MRLCCKVDHAIRAKDLEGASHKRPVLNVAHDELSAGAREVLGMAGVGQGVVNADLVPRGFLGPDKLAPDKSCAAKDQSFHGLLHDFWSL